MRNEFWKKRQKKRPTEQPSSTEISTPGIPPTTKDDFVNSFGSLSLTQDHVAPALTAPPVRKSASPSLPSLPLLANEQEGIAQHRKLQRPRRRRSPRPRWQNLSNSRTQDQSSNGSSRDQPQSSNTVVRNGLYSSSTSQDTARSNDDRDRLGHEEVVLHRSEDDVGSFDQTSFDFEGFSLFTPSGLLVLFPNAEPIAREGDEVGAAAEATALMIENAIQMWTMKHPVMRSPNDKDWVTIENNSVARMKNGLPFFVYITKDFHQSWRTPREPEHVTILFGSKSGYDLDPKEAYACIHAYGDIWTGCTGISLPAKSNIKRTNKLNSPFMRHQLNKCLRNLRLWGMRFSLEPASIGKSVVYLNEFAGQSDARIDDKSDLSFTYFPAGYRLVFAAASGIFCTLFAIRQSLATQCNGVVRTPSNVDLQRIIESHEWRQQFEDTSWDKGTNDGLYADQLAAVLELYGSTEDVHLQLGVHVPHGGSYIIPPKDGLPARTIWVHSYDTQSADLVGDGEFAVDASQTSWAAMVEARLEDDPEMPALLEMSNGGRIVDTQASSKRILN